jgi:phosphatidate cytidylyltransferase
MHSKRLAVAAVVLPLLYLYVMRLPAVYFFYLLAAVTLAAQWEFYSMYRVSGLLKYTGLASGIAVLYASFYAKDRFMTVLFASVMMIMVLRLLVKKTPLYSLQDLAAPLTGILYAPGLLAFQAQLRQIGPEWIIFLYATVWASDSMAYYIGKGYGKKKLYREVSPNKTVAGAFGSLLGGIIGALIMKVALIPAISSTQLMLVGIVIGFISIIGDLIESMFKRDAGVKDSSIIIPGHGGILDKIDGSLFAGPVLYWMLTIINT